MIRINLLPSKASKKKKAPTEGSAFVYLLFLLCVLEVGGLYFWYDSQGAEVIQANTQANQLQEKVRELQKVKQLIAADEEQKILLEEQNQIIERLVDGKVGPPNMLMFLSFALTQPSDTRENAEERKALERAGWNLQWNPNTVWLTRLQEDQHGVMTIEGEARTHEDVAEFYERLRSCYYFEHLEPGPQEEKYNQDVEFPYVAFEASVRLNYRLFPEDEEEGEGGGAKPAEGEGEEAEGSGRDTMIVPGTPSVEAVPGAGGASGPVDTPAP